MLFSRLLQPLQRVVQGIGAVVWWPVYLTHIEGYRCARFDRKGSNDSSVSIAGVVRNSRRVASALLSLMLGGRENRSGALRMACADDSYETAALPGLKDAGIRFEKLSDSTYCQL